MENSKLFISPRISRQPKDKKKLKIPQKKLKNFTQETDPKLQKTHKLTDPSREFEINENGIQKQNYKKIKNHEPGRENDVKIGIRIRYHSNNNKKKKREF